LRPWASPLSMPRPNYFCCCVASPPPCRFLRRSLRLVRRFLRRLVPPRCQTGNLSLRRTAWWGWEDSNFQPNDYQSLALSSRHRWPAPAWHGRRSPHRLAGGMVPTAPDARPSCAIIARALNSISIGGGLRARKRNFCRQRLSAETVSLKFNRLFAETKPRTRKPRRFRHR
jgi:hypothetical protein